jgi:hypothetical protein
MELETIEAENHGPEQAGRPISSNAIIRLAQPGDRPAWNRIAQASPQATYTHTWEWKEAIERGMNVRSLCMVAEQRGALVGIYPGFLTPRFQPEGNLVRLKMMCFGNAQIFWSPLYHAWDYGGPCLLPGIPEALRMRMLNEMERAAKHHKAMDIRLSPPPNAQFQETLLKWGYQIVPRATALIDLTKSEEELWANLKKETRFQIRQGQKLGLEAAEAPDANALEGLYACLEDMAERKDIGLPPKRFFEAALQVLGPSKLVRLYAVKHQGRTVGSAMFVYHKGRTVGRFWGALKEALPLRPYHVLMWKILTDAKKLGCHTCDLGGMPADENHGIHRFKKGWGVRVVPCDWYVKTIRFRRTMAVGQKVLRTLGQKVAGPQIQ